MGEYTTPDKQRIDYIKQRRARELAPLLAEARQHVASVYYRSCVHCHALFAPVFATERLCPDCIAARNQTAHGIVPLPS